MRVHEYEVRLVIGDKIEERAVFLSSFRAVSFAAELAREYLIDGKVEGRLFPFILDIWGNIS